MKKGILFGILLMVLAWPMGLFGDSKDEELSEAGESHNSFLDENTAIYSNEAVWSGYLVNWNYIIDFSQTRMHGHTKSIVEGKRGYASNKPSQKLLFWGFMKKGDTVLKVVRGVWGMLGDINKTKIGSVHLEPGVHMFKDEYKGLTGTYPIKVKVTITEVTRDIRVKKWSVGDLEGAGIWLAPEPVFEVQVQVIE